MHPPPSAVALFPAQLPATEGGRGGRGGGGGELDLYFERRIEQMLGVTLCDSRKHK